MATLDVGSEKAKTLREAIADCEKAQAEIRLQLEKHFDRNPTESEAKTSAIPSRPNVLDEFIDRLIDLNQAQKWTIELIIQQVNSKL